MLAAARGSLLGAGGTGDPWAPREAHIQHVLKASCWQPRWIHSVNLLAEALAEGDSGLMLAAALDPLRESVEGLITSTALFAHRDFGSGLGISCA